MLALGLFPWVEFAQLDTKTYGFDNVAFSTLTDPNGDVLYTLSAESSLVYTWAVDAAMFLPVPGVVNRYRLTALELNQDTLTFSGVMVLDVPDDEPETLLPLPGTAAVGALRPNGVGIAPLDALYPELGSGFHAAVTNVEMERLSHQLGSGSGGGQPAKIITVNLSAAVPSGADIGVVIPTGYTVAGAFLNGTFYTAPELVYANGKLRFTDFSLDGTESLRVFAI